jgi:DNA-directed RNA polymerase subunit RPC12/RpoP
MNLFKKRAPTPTPSAPPPSAASAGLAAHSQFIKRVSCTRCGAPKTLPSATAYLYCDYCGALIDYDFRIANADTNAGLTNTIFHRILAGVQAPLDQFKARGDQVAYRNLFRQVYAQWVQECPLAISPRARSDAAFRERFIDYQVACAVTREFDPRQAPLDAQSARLLAGLQRVPTPTGTWLVSGGFWPYAELYKQQMEMTYALLQEQGVLALDPDEAPPGVPLRMEYSIFCQAWLPHLSPAEGARLLELYGLNGAYDQVQPVATVVHRCAGCGSQLHTVNSARQVVCDACGRALDVANGVAPCSKCGAELTFPVSVKQVRCPYCQTETRRV